MRVFIVAGSPAARQPVDLIPRKDDFVVAADLGARHALAWGWPIHLLVGDLDSLPAETITALREQGVETVRVPAAKDQTDTELALAAALKRGPAEILICGALGGRVDHLLANVLLLAHPSLDRVAVSLVDGTEIAQLAHAGAAPVRVALAGARGDIVSLLPFGADVEGVATENLLYPLYAETLRLGEARGVSNVMTGSRAEVSLTRGRLLIIQNRMG